MKPSTSRGDGFFRSWRLCVLSEAGARIGLGQTKAGTRAEAQRRRGKPRLACPEPLSARIHHHSTSSNPRHMTGEWGQRNKTQILAPSFPCHPFGRNMGAEKSPVSGVGIFLTLFFCQTSAGSPDVQTQRRKGAEESRGRSGGADPRRGTSITLGRRGGDRPRHQPCAYPSDENRFVFRPPVGEAAVPPPFRTPRWNQPAPVSGGAVSNLGLTDAAEAGWECESRGISS